VTVAVRGPPLPRARDELHRADRPVDLAVAVVAATVGVLDLAESTRAVQRHADDRFAGKTRVGEHGATELPVIGLHPADARQRRPGDPASRLRLPSGDLGPAVGEPRAR